MAKSKCGFCGNHEFEIQGGPGVTRNYQGTFYWFVQCAKCGAVAGLYDESQVLLRRICEHLDIDPYTALDDPNQEEQTEIL